MSKAGDRGTPAPSASESPIISMTCSQDGKNVFLSYTIPSAQNNELVIFRSTDYGIMWRRVPKTNINWIGGNIGLEGVVPAIF
ncbi:hypothetical protein ACFL02_08665 [Planctomycetota bacterium]